jgi:hypothetical protein
MPFATPRPSLETIPDERLPQPPASGLVPWGVRPRLDGARRCPRQCLSGLQPQLLAGTVNIGLLLDPHPQVLLLPLQVIQERHHHCPAIGILHRFKGRAVTKSWQGGVHPVAPVGVQHLLNVLLNLGECIETGYLVLVLAPWPPLGCSEDRAHRLNVRGFVSDVMR